MMPPDIQIKMEDSLNSSCVCCSQKLEPPYNLIFDKAGLELKLPTLLLELFNLKLNENEFSDSGICDDCLSDIIQAFDFNKQTDQTEDTKTDLLRENDAISFCEITEAHIKQEVLEDKISFVEEKQEDTKSEPNNFYEIPEANTNIKQEILEDQIPFVEEDYLDEPNLPTLEDILSSEELIYVREKTEHEHTKASNLSEITTKREHPINYVEENENFDFRAYKASILLSTFQDICFPAAIKCRICSEPLGKHEEILSHTERNHCVRNFAYPCIADGNCRPLSSYQELSFHLVFKHYDLHRLVIHVQCKSCKKRFNNFLLFNKHSCFAEKFSTRNTTTHCYDCGKQFRSNKRYRFHLQFHMDTHRPMGCFICDIMIPDEDNFFNHIHYGHEKIQSFPCLQCDRYYNSAEYLKEHEKTHSSEKIYHCKECTNTYTDENLLKQHINNQHLKPVAPCPICGKRLTKQLAMDKHIESHAKPILKDVLCCSKCGLIPDNETDAEEHKRSHENEEVNMSTINIDTAYVCEFCEKAFKGHNTLREHRKTHTDKRFACYICSRSYKDFKSLNAHVSTHTGYVGKKTSFPVHRHYLCDVVDCPKSFLHWTSLTGHRTNGHDNYKGVSCKECPEVCKNVIDYNLHQKLAHSSVPFLCHICSKPCQTRLALSVHVARMHKSDRIQCDECDKEFANSYDVRRHKQAHHQTLKCEECGKVCKNEKFFREHQEKVHEQVKRFFCKTCNKGFFDKHNLDQHMKRVHSDLSYPCKLCDHTTNTRRDLITHMKEHTIKKKKKVKETADSEDTVKRPPIIKVETNPPKKIIYKCPYEGCDGSYPIRGSLNAHIRRKHVQMKHLKLKPRKIVADVKSKRTKRKSEPPTFTNDDDGLEDLVLGDTTNVQEEPFEKKIKSSDSDIETDIDEFITDPEISTSDSIDIKNEAELNCIDIQNEVEPYCVDIKNEAELNCIDIQNEVEPNCSDIKNEAELNCIDIQNEVEPNSVDIKNEAEPNCIDNQNEVEPNCVDIKNEAESNCIDIQNEVEPNCVDTKNEQAPNCIDIQNEVEPNCVDIKNEDQPGYVDIKNEVKPNYIDITKEVEPDIKNEGEPNYTDIKNEVEPNYIDITKKVEPNDIKNQGEPSYDTKNNTEPTHNDTKKEIEPNPIVIKNEIEPNYVEIDKIFGSSTDESGTIETEVVFSKM